jgi:hypothetical protein
VDPRVWLDIFWLLRDFLFHVLLLGRSLPLWLLFMVVFCSWKMCPNIYIFSFKLFFWKTGAAGMLFEI